MNILASTYMVNPFDQAISDFFKNILETTGGYFSKRAEMMTNISGLMFIFIVIGVMLLFKKEYRFIGIVMLCSLALNYICNDLFLKKLFQRERPFIYYGIEPPGFFVHGYSFPSGHSSFTAAGAWSFFFYWLIVNKRQDKTLLAWSIVLIFVNFAVMFSRIALLHHYFTDCLAGLTEGILIALLVVFIYTIIQKRIESKKQLKQNQ